MQINQDKLIIEQKPESWEFPTGIPSKNKYSVLDTKRKLVFFAYEESTSLNRFFLQFHRNLKLIIAKSDKKIKFIIERDAFLVNPIYVIKSPQGELLGKIMKKKWWLGYTMVIYDAKDNLQLTCLPLLWKKHWTYDILSEDVKVAQIQKKFSGLGTEMLTDADNFELDFGSVKDESLKTLLLAAVFAIDLTRFERRNN